MGVGLMGVGLMGVGLMGGGLMGGGLMGVGLLSAAVCAAGAVRSGVAIPKFGRTPQAPQLACVPPTRSAAALAAYPDSAKARSGSRGRPSFSRRSARMPRTSVS